MESQASQLYVFILPEPSCLLLPWLELMHPHHLLCLPDAPAGQNCELLLFATFCAAFVQCIAPVHRSDDRTVRDGFKHCIGSAP